MNAPCLPARTATAALRALSILVALSLAGCTAAGTPTPTPSPPSPLPTVDPLSVSKALHFRTSDGVRLAGRLFGAGPRAVVLVHSFQGDQTEWWDFAVLLSQQGYQVITYDTRGSCPGGTAGCSKGRIDARTFFDVLAAMKVLRDHGADQIGLVGGDFGAFQAMQAAARPDVHAAAVVVVSFLSLFGGESTVRAVGEPKLFIAGRYDSLANASIEDLEEWAQPIKVVKLIPTDARGTQMFSVARAGTTVRETRQAVLDFLRQYV
jgi:pimeloyl-ACP methyl ester carboxylesterase